LKNIGDLPVLDVLMREYWRSVALAVAFSRIGTGATGQMGLLVAVSAAAEARTT